MNERPRRLRANNFIRSMARETRLSSDSLIYPIFIEEGKGIKSPINSMSGQFRYSTDTVFEEVEKALKNGVSKLLLFGIPKEKDDIGSGAYAEDGIVQQGIRAIKERYKNEVYIVSDVCMCEYTSHGHCGILDGEYVDNDKTLNLLSKIALSHVQSGADMVAPSDMMDLRVSAIRETLDNNGFINTPIMSYAVKYASSFYGPFREAAGSAPSFGDRKAYQMDYHNSKEAIREAVLDANEGADILMVKPALSYLDIIKDVAAITTLPVAAYSVSGEYAMIKAAASMGYVDEYKLMCETAVSIYRAGANILISYYAKELSKAIKSGDIG